MPSDSTFVDKANRFLRGTGWDMVYPGQQHASALGSEFVQVIAHAGDFQADVVVHRDGEIVFAATRVWSGTGRQLFPTEPLDPWVIRRLAHAAKPPQSVSEEDALPPSLLDAVLHLSPTHAFAAEPYSLTSFRWDRSLEGFGYDPSWVILLARPGKCF